MPNSEISVVAGVGPGLGSALVRCFAEAGMRVACVARNVERLDALAKETGGGAYACDITDESSVEVLFERIGRELGAPSLVVHNPSWFGMKPFLELNQADFVGAWRIACFGGFLVGRAAARAMLPEGGTILYTGSTPSIRAGAG